MSRNAIRVSIALLGALVLVLPISPARGHRAGRWYGARWPNHSVVWRFDRDFPRSRGARNAVMKGSRQWNHAGAQLRFRRDRTDREAGKLAPCSQPRGQNYVQWGRLDGPGGRLAVTVTCTFGEGTGTRQMYSFQMLFDKEETWHFDPSTPPGPGETDMWAVASHEFGHAGGRITGGPGDQGHWPESSNLCPDLLNDRRHTMCPSYDFIGTVMRTLERHDIDTFRNAYGRR